MSKWRRKRGRGARAAVSSGVGWHTWSRWYLLGSGRNRWMLLPTLGHCPWPLGLCQVFICVQLPSVRVVKDGGRMALPETGCDWHQLLALIL